MIFLGKNTVFKVVNRKGYARGWVNLGSMRLGIRYCYDLKPVRKEEGKSYWKIPSCDDDATREK